MDLVLNQVAIWHGCGAKELNIKNSPAGRTYRTAENPVFAKTKNTCYRYAKDYTVKKLVFCLMVFSDISDKAVVEKQLDEIAKTVTKEQALDVIVNSTETTFKYLQSILKGVE